MFTNPYYDDHQISKQKVIHLYFSLFQTDYTRHLDDIIKETELLLLKTTQNLFLSGENDQAVNLLKQWRICSTFLAEGKICKCFYIKVVNASFRYESRSVMNIIKTFCSSSIHFVHKFLSFFFLVSSRGMRTRQGWINANNIFQSTNDERWRRRRHYSLKK